METGDSTQYSGLKSTKGSRPHTNPLVLLGVAIFIAAVIGGAVYYKYYRIKPIDNHDVILSVTGFSAVPVEQKLDARYTDAEGDMVADAPTDPAKLVTPTTLTFSYVAVDDPTKSEAAWKPFCDYLAKQTGLKVDYLPVTSTRDEISAMRDGKLWVAGFNTGAVPTAVNKAGFVPLFGMPTGDGTANTHTVIIVPADSDIQKPQDLKGRTLTLTEPSSNSGYKAPMVALRSQFNLEPITDVLLHYSGSHQASIAGIAAHKYEAAAVSADLLKREENLGNIKPDQYRIIYASEDFPTSGLGYAYNLAPNIAKKVREAMTSFDWRGTSLQSEVSDAKSTKFVPVTYKNDWSLIRRIDAEMNFELPMN